VSGERIGQEQLPLYHVGEPELDRYQRIETLGEVAGFLPVTKPEQVEVMGLMSFSPRQGGAAKHIAEVARRQHTKANMEDPTATSRKLVRNYVDWMTNARESSRALSMLETELKEVLNPELKLAVARDELSQPGLLAFMRYYDLALLAKAGDIESVGYDPQKVAYSTDNQGIIYYLEAAMESWRIQQVRRQLPQAQTHEANRFIFWAERVNEVAKHSPKQLKAIALDGLDKVYERTRVE
jgi:hypothetical protein